MLCIFYILVRGSCCFSPKPVSWLQQLMFSFDCPGTRHSLVKAVILNNTLFPKSHQELGRAPYCFLYCNGEREWEFRALLWVRREPKMLMHNICQGRLCPDFSVLHPVTLSSAKWHWEGRESPGCPCSCACTPWLPAFIDKTCDLWSLLNDLLK